MEAILPAKSLVDRTYEALLDAICTGETSLEELPGVFARMLAGGSLGRTVVRL